MEVLAVDGEEAHIFLITHLLLKPCIRTCCWKRLLIHTLICHERLNQVQSCSEDEEPD
jgi:hypothetical protein